MRRQDQVFLLLAHATLERVRLPRVILGDACAPRPAEDVQGADQQQAVDALGRCRIEHPAHQDRMQAEVRVRDAHHVHDRADAAQRLPDRCLVLRIPGRKLGERIAAKRLFERRP